MLTLRQNHGPMRNRKHRLSVIADIIASTAVASQDEMLRLLAARGFIITQATLSRDLKLLRTNKVPTDLGGYTYTFNDKGAINNTVQSALHPAAVSVALSGNMLVIKTRNGYASGLAYDMDSLNSPLILGTIAGADTVFAVVRAGVDRAELCEMLSGFLPSSIVGQLSHD